jgi:hypothetical protein
MKVAHKKIYIFITCVAIVALVSWMGYMVGHGDGYKSGLKDGSKGAYSYAECLFRNSGSRALSDPPKCLDSKGEHVFPKAP